MSVQLKLRVAKSGASSHYLPIPEAVAQQILQEFGKRIVCVVKGRPPLHCALLRSNAIGYYIMLGKKSRQQLNITFGEELELKIDQDRSQYQAKVPQELQVVLETDPQGLEQFERLSDGKKRSIIHYIDRAKQSDTRINRALKLVERIKRGQTNSKDLFR
ncbi:MAG: YdeI/OmpD-associated family protein [Bacteroidota bacterium]